MSDEAPLATRLQQLEQKVEALESIRDEARVRVNVAELEERVRLLKARLPEGDGGRTFRAGAKRVYRHVLDNWGFFAFLFALAVAAVVYVRYGIGYFESYENTYNTKTSAQYYVDIGERLLMRAEFGAAEDAFATALGINSNNLDARHGLMKAQVLKPVEGRKKYTPEIVQAKLKYLEELFKSKGVNQHLIFYFKGVMKEDQDDQKAARQLFEDSKTVEPNFIGNYIELGKLDLFEGKVDEAAAQFKLALEKAPDHTKVLTYLGSCYLVTLKFNDAKDALLKAYDINPQPETYLLLGEVFRYSGELDEAVFMHQSGLRLLNEPNGGAGGSPDPVTFNFMPEKLGDSQTTKVFEQAGSPEQFLTLTHYALSIDYALQKNFPEAEKAFSYGISTDKLLGRRKEYGCFYINKINFMKSMMKLDGEVTTWLDGKIPLLDPTQECRE